MIHVKSSKSGCIFDEDAVGGIEVISSGYVTDLPFLRIMSKNGASLGRLDCADMVECLLLMEAISERIKFNTKYKVEDASVSEYRRKTDEHDMKKRLGLLDKEEEVEDAV